MAVLDSGDMFTEIEILRDKYRQVDYPFVKRPSERVESSTGQKRA